MNEPQLSEEMEKRFNEAFPNEESGYLNKQGKYVHLFNPAVDSREIKTFLATALEEQRAEGAAEEQKKMIDRLRNTMDEYNSLPEDATQFAFYLKVADMKDFFEALTTKEIDHAEE